jgi:S-adenosylmethionine decarboxylase
VTGGLRAELGPHFVFDGFGCPAGHLEDLDRIYGLLDSLPAAIRMTKVMPPYVFLQRARARGGDGVSGLVLVAGSHIALHTFPRRHFLNVDVSSGQAFDVEVVLTALQEAFEPRRVGWKLRDRGAAFPRALEDAHAMVVQDRALVAEALGLGVSS